MNDIVLTVGGMIVGVIGSFFITKHFYQLGINNSQTALTPYLQFASSLFAGAKERVREDLKIFYRGTPVEDLTEVQFFVGNTGERPIRNILKPLTLHVPDGAMVLEATILHIHPEGREVEVKVDPLCDQIVYTFPLLNAGEYFITKILLSGEVTRAGFRFYITAEDLPPTLEMKPFDFDLLESDDAPKKSFDWQPLAFGLGLILIAAGITRLAYEALPLWTAAFQGDFLLTLKQNRWIMISSILGLVPVVLLLIVGTILLLEGLFGSLRQHLKPRRRRFRVPYRAGLRVFGSGYFVRTGGRAPLIGDSLSARVEDFNPPSS